MATTDGGPAFPQALIETRDGAIQCSYDAPDGSGLTLRDYFAARALPQAIAHERDVRAAMIAPDGFRFDAVAEAAYMMADAMLRARDVKSPAETMRAHLDTFGGKA